MSLPENNKNGNDSIKLITIIAYSKTSVRQKEVRTGLCAGRALLFVQPGTEAQ
jgi:hypothetical protein